MIPAAEALQRLREGNQRFVAGTISLDALAALRNPEKLEDGQTPFAVILGCSDSRVPVEMVFDQSLGDLFVIRVAGNIAAPSQIGSAEFAAAKFGTRLIVVMGHSQCGAIAAAIGAVRHSDEAASYSLGMIVRQIRPAVEQALAEGGAGGDQAVAQRAMQMNVHAMVRRLREDSPILQKLIAEEGLMVVGATYSLKTGEVEFLGEATS